MAIIRNTAIIMATAAVDFTAEDEGKAVYIVKPLDVAGGCAAYATSAAATSAASGTGTVAAILVRAGAEGEPVEVALPGCGAIIEGRCGGAVTAGAALAAGTDGTLTVAGNGSTAVAVALSAGESGDLIPVTMK